MNKVGLWQIVQGHPQQIREANIALEQHLETWIEADPGLLQAGLVIVGRQLSVEGGRLDLLALDTQGRWVVIEIKRGPLQRESIAQVLDYASYLAELPKDDLQRKVDAYLQPRGQSLLALLNQRDALDALNSDMREVVLFVVGAGTSPGLERMVSFLAEHYGMPITLVSFDVFTLVDGQQILARELHESGTAEIAPARATQGSTVTVEQICVLADQNGVGRSFRAIMRMAEEAGLYMRPYKKSIMYTPPANRNRMLFTVSATSTDQKLKTYIGASAFAEFYPLSIEEATTLVGEDGWRAMDDEQVEQFVLRLQEFFRQLEKAEQ